MTRCSGGVYTQVRGEHFYSPHASGVFAAFLDALNPGVSVRCSFESLGRSAGPFAWLAAMDRLLAHGTTVLNLSYGRRAVERGEGWAALEWGTQLLARLSGAVIIAAAGQPSPGRHMGSDLHLPASVPEVLTADGPERAWGDPPGWGEERILLASSEDPMGGLGGSSFSAPRITALVCEILYHLPQKLRTRELVQALLLASCEPPLPGIPAAGRPNPDRLRAILRDGPPHGSWAGFLAHEPARRAVALTDTDS